jgi:hypothetical protein
MLALLHILLKLMRKGYLGLFESAHLSGASAMRRKVYEMLSQICTEQGIQPPVESIPVSKMIYIAAFQGGVERFLTAPSRSFIDCVNDPMLSRRVALPNDQCNEILNWAFEISSSLEPRGSQVGSEARDILFFVHDLIVAMANNSAVIKASRIPTKDSVIKALPADVALPICNLLACLSSSEELLPAPKASIPKDQVYQMKTLIESGTFAHYASAHSDIELMPRERGLARIHRFGEELLNSGSNILCKRPMTLTLLPVIPKIVDIAFGKLPGMLAQAAGDLALKYASEKKSIVIYRFDDCIRDYSKASFIDMLEGLDPVCVAELRKSLERLRESRKS